MTNGHIKLIDFGLSFNCPTLLERINGSPRHKKNNRNCSEWLLYTKDSNIFSPYMQEPIPDELELSYKSDNSSSADCRSCNSATFLPKNIGNYLYSSPEIMNNEEYDYMVDWWSLAVLLFHFISGRTPFESFQKSSNLLSQVDEQKTIDNIRKQKVNWSVFPKSAGLSRQFISDILSKPFEFRLGYNNSDEIFYHPYFADINFKNLLSKPGPLIPNQGEESEFKSYLHYNSSDNLITVDMIGSEIGAMLELEEIPE